VGLVLGDADNGSYTYSGTLARLMVSQVRTKVDWNLEFAAPVRVALPGRLGHRSQTPKARDDQGEHH
jgi:hypothetical protein